MAGLFHAVSKQHNPLGTLVRVRGTGRYTFGLALSAGLAGLLYGYDTVSISGAIDFLTERYALGPTMEGTIISSVMFGGVIGAMFAGFLSDRFGRRRILMAGAAFFFFAAILSALTFSPFQLIATRTVGGVGIGLTAALAVAYITESAPTHIRGTLAFSYQMLAICGIFLTNVINYVIASYGSPQWDVAIGWRWMLGIGALPAAVFFLAMLRAPESPRFLIQSGRADEGFRVLEHISGTDKAREMSDAIQDTVDRERELDASFADLFRPGLRKALVIGVFLAVFNQAIGVNVISYYGPVMFKDLGFGDDTEFLASAAVGGVELTATVVGMYLIDAVGRKRLMAVGSALMTLFALAISWSYAVGSSLSSLVFVMLFAAAFAFSMGPIPWIVIPELFPTFLRGRAVGICTGFLLATNWAVGQFTPMMFRDLGGLGTFLAFAGLDALCLAGVLVLVPETMDRTLEDIERDWQPKTPLASARIALGLANSRIRRAESTLARVENERMQAMGVIEQAERDRLNAQKELFRLENEERERIERQKREARARAAAKEAKERAKAAAKDTKNVAAAPDAPAMPAASAASAAPVAEASPDANDGAASESSTRTIARHIERSGEQKAQEPTHHMVPEQSPTTDEDDSDATEEGFSSKRDVRDLHEIIEQAKRDAEAEEQRENAAIDSALDSLDDLIGK